MRGEAERWLREALWDLETAELLYRARRWNAAALAFYAQQAGEKAAEALLYSVNEAPWGHSVRLLLERYFERIGERDEMLLRCARELNRHYIPSGYPNAHPPGVTPHEAYDEEAAGKALEAARRIVEYARRKLGVEGRVATWRSLGL